MAGEAPAVVRLGGSEPLPEWQPAALERRLPGGGVMWVHGATGKDAARWLGMARNWAGERGLTDRDGKPRPTPEMLALCQVITVCRQGPGDADPTFIVGVHQLDEVMGLCQQHLPAEFVETVCRESDQLSLLDYYPPKGDRQARTDEAQTRLGEQLADQELWSALSLVSLKLYGVPLADNGRPLGDVLSHLQRDIVTRMELLQSLGTLAAAAGVGG